MIVSILSLWQRHASAPSATACENCVPRVIGASLAFLVSASLWPHTPQADSPMPNADRSRSVDELRVQVWIHRTGICCHRARFSLSHPRRRRHTLRERALGYRRVSGKDVLRTELALLTCSSTSIVWAREKCTSLAVTPHT
jgi:hypothetical protein